MKKLILIFSLLLSSLNLSAELLKDNYFIKTMRSNEVDREQIAQESFDTYETFLEFNAQQDRDNPTGSRVSEDLMNDAKTLATFDLIQYAIIETFEAAIARDETITTEDEIQQQDIVDGINAAREIIGPLVKNPVFSAQEQQDMSIAVNKYLNAYRYDRSQLNISDFAMSIVVSVGGNKLLERMGKDYAPRNNMAAANRFSSNFLSTFFTNQNAVQSTCLSASCAAPM